MSQSNYVIANTSAPVARAQMNTVFGSIASNNSGATAPATTFPFKWWYDTAANILKMRNAADDGWIDIAEFNQAESSVSFPLSLAALTEETTPADADLLLLEKGTGGAKRKVRVDNIGGAPTTSEVLTATAGASAGAIGTYAFLGTRNTTTTVAFGATIAGSNLRPLGANYAEESGAVTRLVGEDTVQSGTWRAMGRKPARIFEHASALEGTLFLRIS